PPLLKRVHLVPLLYRRLLLFHCSPDPRYLPSFPTRRSSDLFLEAAAEEKRLGHALEIIVLDRPVIIGGTQVQGPVSDPGRESYTDRKSTRLNSSHQIISYAVFCLKKKTLQCSSTKSNSRVWL